MMSNDDAFDNLVEYANLIAIARFLLRKGVYDNATYNKLVFAINKKPEYVRISSKKVS